MMKPPHPPPGCTDLLYHTPEHGVSESSRSNLFYVKVGRVVCSSSLQRPCALAKEGGV